MLFVIYSSYYLLYFFLYLTTFINLLYFTVKYEFSSVFEYLIAFFRYEYWYSIRVTAFMLSFSYSNSSCMGIEHAKSCHIKTYFRFNHCFKLYMLNFDPFPNKELRLT